MEKLKIIKKEKYNQYVLQKGESQMIFILGFYDMPQPDEGDILIVNEEYLNTSSPDFVRTLYFKPLEEKEKADVKKSDIAGLHTKDKNYLLRRIYG